MVQHKIGDLVKISKGKKVSETTPLQEAGSNRFIQIDDLRSNSNLKFTKEFGVFAKDDDVIIAWDGANAGTVGYNLTGIIGSTLAKLEIQSEVISGQYLGRFLQSKFRYLRDRCTGATIPHISKKVLINLSIPLPPIEDQKRIVKILDQADALRQKRKQSIALLDEYVKSVFLEMFGDPRNSNRFSRKKMGELCTIVGGGTPSKKESSYYDGQVHWATSKDIKEIVLKDTSLKISARAVDVSSTKLVPKDTLLMVVKSKILMKYLPLSISRNDVCFNQDIKGIIVNREIDPWYLLFHLKIGQDSLLSIARGVNTEGLTLEHLKNYSVILPNKQLQISFSEIAQNTYRLQQKMLQQSQELETQFQALMQKAFRGELLP